MNRYIKKLYRIFINIIAILYLVFDGVFVYLNDRLSQICSYIPSIENIREYWRDRIANMNKYIVLAILLGFLGASEVLGIVSFAMLSQGLIIPFVFLYIFKFLPFFVMNFIFKYSKDELLTIKWFNYCYFKIIDFTNYLKSTEIVQKTVELKDSIKLKIQKINDWRKI